MAGLVAFLSITAGASAQNARVYVANSANSRVLSAQFNPPSATVVIDDANKLTKVRDIAIRDDGLQGANLIACDRNGGRIVFYQNAGGTGQVIFDAAVTAGPNRPDGTSLNLAGDLFVMNSGQGSSGGASQVWVMKRDAGCPNPGRPECLNGGYRKPLGLIDPDVLIATEIGGVSTLVETTLLPESLVSTSSAGVLSAGDLLVLTNPGALVRYGAAEVAAFLSALAAGQTPGPLTPDTIIHPSNASVPDDERFPDGAVPTGMAFAPGGGLLISASDGRILMYGADGHRRSDGAGHFVDFTTGAGSDDFKIAVGLQDGKMRAFVTHQAQGSLYRYTFAANGTGILDSVVGGLQFPVGVDATNSNTVPAPAGSNVNIAPTTIMATNIDRVLLAGQVNATVSTFPDPREKEETTPPNQPLHRSLFLNELRADLPPIEIPAWARAFPFDNPSTGVPTFILIEAKTGIAVSGLLNHLADESSIFGYEPNCQDADITRQPFMFWSPDANDPPIVEGAKFIDITTGCGTIRGVSQTLSYFLVGVRITAPMQTVAATKLDSLNTVISGNTCIAPQLRKKLGNLMDRALRDFGRGRYSDVAVSLKSIDDTVGQSPQSFMGCAANVAGEIQARARSAIFTLSKVN